jgi:protein SCO1/2
MKMKLPISFDTILKSIWTWPIIGLVVGLGSVILLGLYLRPHQFSGTLLQSPKPAYNFTLTGPQDNPVSLKDFNGKVVLLFFGYTSCPDVCPTTMQKLRDTRRLLGQKADRVQVIMVSVDPEKDTTKRLNGYLSMFDPTFIGLTGNLEDITMDASQYGVFFEKRPYNEKGGYLIDHTATVMLIDPNGYLRVIYPFNATASGITDDIIYILSR